LIGSEFDIIASVADGQRAIESAIRLNPDVLMLDISMPFRNASKSNIAGCSFLRKSLRLAIGRKAAVNSAGFLRKKLTSIPGLK